MIKPFIILPSADGQFYVNIRSQNGETLSTSELLKTHQAAIKNILSALKIMSKIAYHPAEWNDIMAFVPEPFIVDVSKDQKRFVKMRAPNHEILYTSEMFNSYSAAIGNIGAHLRSVAAIAYHEAEWNDWEAFTVDTTVQKPQAHE